MADSNECLFVKLHPDFVEPACGEREIVVTTSVRCTCVRRACVRLSGIIRTITFTFIYGFRNYLAYLFFLRVEVPIETFIQIN